MAGTTSTTSSAPPPSGVPTRARGHAEGAGGELHGRHRSSSRARSAAPRSRSTASPGWSTTSATRRPATGRRCSTGSRTTSIACSPASRSIRCCAGSRRRRARTAFPKRAFLRLIAANRQDQEVSRYETYDELARLLRPLGQPGRRARALHVFGAATPERIALSDSRLHRPAARRALAGRRRGLPPRPRLPAAGGPASASASTRTELGAGGRATPELRLIALRGRARRARLLDAGIAARPLAARPRDGSRSPATSAAGAPRSTRSSARGYDVLGAPPKATKRARVRRQSSRPCGRRRWTPTEAYATAGGHAARGGELLLRHPPAAGPRRARAVRRLRARPARRRHRRRRGAATRRSCGRLDDGAAPTLGARSTRRYDDPVLVALADAATRYPIPLDAFGELIDGVEMDVARHALRDVRRPARLLPPRRRLDRAAVARRLRDATTARRRPATPTTSASPCS